MYSSSPPQDDKSSDAKAESWELCQFDLFSCNVLVIKHEYEGPRMCLPVFWFENFAFITIDSNKMKKKNGCCHSTFTLNMLRWSVSVTNIQQVVKYTWLSRKTCIKDEIRYCEHNSISIITVLQKHILIWRIDSKPYLFTQPLTNAFLVLTLVTQLPVLGVQILLYNILLYFTCS